MVVGSGASIAPTSATVGVVSANKINNTALAGLGTGILKNTTGTGVPSIAVAADFPTLNQSTSGNANTATQMAYQGFNCPAGQAAAGVDQFTNAEGCAAYVANSTGVPGISGCGSGAALSSNATDEGGTLTLGSSPGACVITFSATYTTDPKCVVSFQAAVLAPYSHSATALTITATGLSGALDYRCAK